MNSQNFKSRSIRSQLLLAPLALLSFSSIVLAGDIYTTQPAQVQSASTTQVAYASQSAYGTPPATYGAPTAPTLSQAKLSAHSRSATPVRPDMRWNLAPTPTGLEAPGVAAAQPQVAAHLEPSLRAASGQAAPQPPTLAPVSPGQLAAAPLTTTQGWPTQTTRTQVPSAPSAQAAAPSLQSPSAIPAAGQVATGGMSGGGIPETHLSGAATGTPSAQPPSESDPVYAAWEEFLAQRRASGATELGSVVQQDSPVAAGPLAGALTRSGLGGTGSFGGVLALVFGGMGLAGAFLARKKSGPLQTWLSRRTLDKRDRNRVRVMSVNPLSSQGSIAVVEVFDQILVLGVTAGRVSLLTRINQDGSPASVEKESEDIPMESTSSLFKESANPPANGRVANDFSALLNNLARDSESVNPDANSPLARYAAMSGVRRDAALEPPPEDMAGQVLRKMKTMKRFRNAA